MMRGRQMVGCILVGVVVARGGWAQDSVGADPVAIATHEVAQGWSARTVRTGDAVVFPFGRAQPQLTCAPLRACVIVLEAGEKVLGKASGDTERWLIAQTSTGPGGRTALLVVKPTDCNLTTNLVVTTDRRVYDVTLTSAPCVGRAGGATAEYTRIVRFYYPDELLVGGDLTGMGVTRPMLEDTAGDPSARGTAPARLNFAYTVQPDRGVRWAPQHVYDDGAHVYIRLPEHAQHGALPVLFEVGRDGARGMLNYAVNGDVYVTDRVFTRAVLVVTDGRHEETVKLTNESIAARR
jgi:type IV secretion system protein TrbG